MNPDTLKEWFPVVVNYAGLAGVIWQTVLEQVDRPALLATFALMMGIARALDVLFAKNGNGGDK